MATPDRSCLFLRQLPGGTHLEQVARFERRGRIVCDKQGSDRKGWASRLSVRLRHFTIERKHFVRLGFWIANQWINKNSGQTTSVRILRIVAPARALCTCMTRPLATADNALFRILSTFEHFEGHIWQEVPFPERRSRR